MKILFITSSLDVKDGWGRYSNGVVKEIAKENDVLVLSHIFHEMDGVHQKAVLHSPLSVANPLKIFLASRRIQHYVNSFKPDVVHFLVEPYVLALPLLRTAKKTKKILTVHGTYSFMPFMFLEEKLKSAIVSSLVRRSYDKIDRIISVSSYTKLYLLQKYKEFYKKDFDEEKIKVISNGIDMETHSFNPDTKIKKDKKSIIFVGAIKRRKGVLESINVLVKYKETYGGDFTYTVVGAYDENDSYVDQVKSRIKENSLQDNVVFAGFVEQAKLDSLYAEADLFLMLSIQSGLSVEGFGLVYLEANAKGVPTIGSKESGAVDAISDGVSGYLVDPYNLIEAAEKIHLVIDKGLIMPEDCFTWAKKQDIKEKGKLLLSVYKKE